MRKTLAAALLLTAAPVAAEPVDYASAISGYIIAEDYCGLDVPADIKIDALEKALATKSADRLRSEVIALTRIILMEFQDTEIALDFCVEMGEHFK